MVTIYVACAKMHKLWLLVVEISKPHNQIARSTSLQLCFNSIK